MEPTRVVFFGTPEFSVPFLRALAADPAFQVVAAVSQPDRPSGRGHEIVATPVKAAAERLGIPSYQPPSLKKPEYAEPLRAYDADVFVVVAYGKIIPKDVLEMPKHGCVNVHPSLLPRHRGPSPMQWAIAEGDANTGVTIMVLDEGMDTGPLLAFVNIGIDSDETYATLARKAQEQGAPLLVETLKRYVAGEIIPVPQDDAKATLTRLLEREDGRIDWTKPTDVIERRARAYQPWPGTWTVWNRNGEELRLKIARLQPVDFRSDLPPGTVSIKNNRLFADCSDGTMELLEVQPEGKPSMAASAFLGGYSDIDGAVLA